MNLLMGIFLFYFYYLYKICKYIKVRELDSQPMWVDLVMKAWDLEVCSSQGFRFESSQCHFMRWTSPYKVKTLALNGLPTSGR
jgi:hypothetical protein